jgi:hypothetical protein
VSMRCMNMNRQSRWSAATVATLLALAGLAGTATLALDPSPAQAVIGRPFTPLSYGGMARRTSRRTSRRVAYRHGAYGAYGGAAYATTLPAGCAMAAGVYNCGAASYQPYYDGPNIVYVEAD